MGYSFGLPVIASQRDRSHKTSFPAEPVFRCKPRDAQDLARTIRQYFASDLFKDLELRRQEIVAYAQSKNSWDTVVEITREVYASL